MGGGSFGNTLFPPSFAYGWSYHLMHYSQAFCCYATVKIYETLFTVKRVCYCISLSSLFDVHRTVPRYISSIVKPAICTIVSNSFYFGMALYMFRTVFASIIRSSRLYIQQQAFVKQILLSASSSRQRYLFDKCLLLYVQSWTPDDGRKDRPKLSVIPK